MFRLVVLQHGHPFSCAGLDRWRRQTGAAICGKDAALNSDVTSKTSTLLLSQVIRNRGV
jgi:hypothetical protein